MRLIGRSTSMSRLQYLSILGLRLQNLIGSHMVVLHLHHWLPPHAPRVLDHMHLRLCSAVEHHVEPVVLFKPLSGFVLVGRECHLIHMGTALHLNKADLNGG